MADQNPIVTFTMENGDTMKAELYPEVAPNTVNNFICGKLKENIKNFWQDEDGMGVVEIVLIIVVLIGLVIIFKSQITALVNKLLSKMSSQANKI